MPNVTWLEPHNMVDLLSLNLLSDRSGMRIPGNKHIAIISPWISDVELQVGPSVWHKNISTGNIERRMRLLPCLEMFLQAAWIVEVAVLKYGTTLSASGLKKPWDDYEYERRFLDAIRSRGAQIYLCPNQHAKGLVTPLGCVTGSTNYTRSGLYLQSQNTNYFPYSHPDYPSNCAQLLSRFATTNPYTKPLLSKLGHS